VKFRYSRRAKTSIEEAEARFLRVPIYSPDFNPIEESISKIEGPLGEEKISMKFKMSMKAVYASRRRNRTVAHGLKVDSGYMSQQHIQTMASGLKIKTGVKAGPAGTPIIRD
jgi:hypothetical protein